MTALTARARCAPVIGVLLGAVLAGCGGDGTSVADLVVLNGRLLTLASPAEAEALAAADGRIVFVGSSDDARSWIGPGTEVLDLEGRLGVPGFIEGHGHFWGVGEARLQLALDEARTWDEIVAQIAEAELGADHVVNYRDADWVEQVLDYTDGRGVDVAQDLVGALTWADSLRTLARNGRLVVCGSHSGKNLDLPIPQIYHRQLSVLGSNGGTYNELCNCLDLANQGVLRPVIDRVLPLSQIREGHRILEEHDHFGKVVIQVA